MGSDILKGEKMKKILFILLACLNCSGESKPNIRTQPGIEYCEAMCNKFKELQCVGYYEDLQVPLEDGNTETFTCVQFCEYEQRNSVQLNPKCLVEQLTNCADIELICKN
jgi:hypothetical protein